MTLLSSLASGGSETRCRGKRRSWLGGPVRRLARSPCLALGNAQRLGKSTEPLWPNPGHWSFARCCCAGAREIHGPYAQPLLDLSPVKESGDDQNHEGQAQYQYEDFSTIHLTASLCPDPGTRT